MISTLLCVHALLLNHTSVFLVQYFYYNCVKRGLFVTKLGTQVGIYNMNKWCEFGYCMISISKVLNFIIVSTVWTLLCVVMLYVQLIAGLWFIATSNIYRKILQILKITMTQVCGLRPSSVFILRDLCLLIIIL